MVTNKEKAEETYKALKKRKIEKEKKKEKDVNDYIALVTWRRKKIQNS